VSKLKPVGRVLLVEDDRYLNQLLSKQLALQGFEVDSCMDGEEAWNKLQSAPTKYSSLVLDMLLPKLMGAELLSKLQEQSSAFENIQKIGISGVFKNEDEIRQIKQLHHLSAYLTKPFSIEELVAALRGEDLAPSDDLKRSGHLLETPIEKLLLSFYSSGRTGSLQLHSKNQRRRIFFLNGHPVAGDSSSITESFGNSLVRFGLISEEIRNEASTRMVAEKKQFGEMLLSLNAITKDELFKGLRRHHYELLLNSFFIRDGEFEFTPLEEIPSHIPRIEFNPFILALEAQRKLLTIEALASLTNLKMDLFACFHEKAAVLLPLINLSPECLSSIENWQPELRLREALHGVEGKYREETLRLLYLLESLAMLRWTENPQEALSPMPSAEPIGPARTPRSETNQKKDDELFSEYMDILNQDFFEILRIKTDATSVQIEQAYRQTRLLYHPDEYGGDLSGQGRRILDDILARLDQAYQVLSVPADREEYQRTLGRLSADSAADSKRYLEALEIHRQASAVLAKEDFEGAKKLFDEAYRAWPSGIEYRLYSLFCEIRPKLAPLKPEDRLKLIGKFKESALAQPQIETGHLLLGHLFRHSSLFEEARAAYQKALQINPHSSEVANALASIADEAGPKRKFKNPFRLRKDQWKNLGLFILLCGAGVAAYFAYQAYEFKDRDALLIETSMISEIFPAELIRAKGDVAKIDLERNWIKDVPPPVLRTKCTQALDILGRYGILRLYLAEEGKGLAAFCTKDHVQRYTR